MQLFSSWMMSGIGASIIARLRRRTISFLEERDLFKPVADGDLFFINRIPEDHGRVRGSVYDQLLREGEFTILSRTHSKGIWSDNYFTPAWFRASSQLPNDDVVRC